MSKILVNQTVECLMRFDRLDRVNFISIASPYPNYNSSYGISVIQKGLDIDPQSSNSYFSRNTYNDIKKPPAVLSIHPVKNSLVSMELWRSNTYYTGNLRIMLGAVLENRTTNSLDTVNAWVEKTGPFSLARLVASHGLLNRPWDVIDYSSIQANYSVVARAGDGIYSQWYIDPSQNNFKTDPRDLSHYFLVLNTTNDTISIGKNIRGNETVLKTAKIKRNGNYYGQLTLSCFQSGPATVTISCRVGTSSSNLPYTTITARDSNNILSANESRGRYGFITRGPSPLSTSDLRGYDRVDEGGFIFNRQRTIPIYAKNLAIGARSQNDQFSLCSDTPYIWINSTDTGNNPPPPPPPDDPNPPQEGQQTIISTIGSVVLSYDNSGPYQDLLKINNIPIRLRYDRISKTYPYVNRFDLLKSGWIPVAAASDSRINSRALQTGGNNTIANTLILRKTESNFITFWRMLVQTINRPSLPAGSWIYGSSDGWLSPSSTKTYNVETILNFDVNGDSLIGAPPPPEEPEPETVNISSVNNVILSYDTAGVDKDLLKVNGSLLKDYTNNNINYVDYLHNSYEAVGAATINGENFLVWRTPENGTPFVKNLIEALPIGDKITIYPSQIKITQTQLTTIQIRFSYPVTGVTKSAFTFYLSGLKQSVNFVLTGSGQDYTLTIPAGEINRTGTWELRIFSSSISSNINNRQVIMKKPSRLYWAYRRRSPSRNIPSDPTTNPASTTLVVWKMSSLWKLISNNAYGIYPLNTTNYYQAETNFNIDFNNDGKIGNPTPPPPDSSVLTTIENAGNVVLSYDENDYLRANGTILSYNGSPISRISTGWEFLAAEYVDGKNSLLLRSKSNGFSNIYRFDQNWSYESSDTYAAPGSDNFFATETLFNIDIDNDNTIGRNLSAASIPVQTGSGITFSYDRSGEDTNLLKINGSLVKDVNNQNVNVADYLAVKWIPISAGVVDGINTIVWRYIDNGYLSFWRLNESWVQTSADGWFVPGSPPYYATETLFGLDFNNDGRIGNPFPPPPPQDQQTLTSIESFGNVSLAYDQTNSLVANGQLVKFNNVPIKRSPNDWAFLAAENINGVNTLLCQWKTSGFLHLLQFDNNWNSTGGYGWYAPGTSDFYAVELLFGSDIDNNGNIGPAITMNSGFVENIKAISNQNIPLSVSLITNLSDASISFQWEYDIGSGWTPWVLAQNDTPTSSDINVVFLPNYTSLKIRCKALLSFAAGSLAANTFGGNIEVMSKEFTATKKTEENYVLVNSAVPTTFTFNKESQFNIDDLPKNIQDSIGIIIGGDLGPDYITGLPASWTPLCAPLEQSQCGTYNTAQTNGVYGSRLFKQGLTYTIYPRTISFSPFIIDFENI